MAHLKRSVVIESGIWNLVTYYQSFAISRQKIINSHQGTKTPRENFLINPWCTFVPWCLGGKISLFGSGSSGLWSGKFPPLFFFLLVIILQTIEILSFIL